MKKNDLVEVTCEYLSTDAKGVAKTTDGVLYIPNLLPEEKALVAIDEVKGKTIYASLREIHINSNFRVKTNCPSYTKCGSCNLRHYDYQKQLEFKKNNVYLAFKNEEMKVKVEDVLGMENPDNYRNKVIASFGMRNKEIVYGLYEEGTHNIIPNSDCPIQNDKLNEVLKSIKESMKVTKVLPYDDFTKRGSIRHVVLRIGIKTNEIMVVFVTIDDIFPGRANLVKELVKRHSDIKTIVQNVNSRNTSIILGEKERVLYGSGYISDYLLGMKFKISPKSFYQVNPSQTEVLYNTALKLANLKKNDTVLDAYCGIGTISLAASKLVNKIYGVEIVKDAINDAMNNARENNIKNTFFRCDDASKYIMNFNEKLDCLIVDPPRKGCEESFINAINKMLPQRIVYISCNPVTQAQDIKLLLPNYDIKVIQPVDMFPHTLHVETVVLLEKQLQK